MNVPLEAFKDCPCDLLVAITEEVAHVVPRDLAGVDAVGVTVEPAGGSPQPTTDPFLLTHV